jgi:FixJ family two-component response regulator
MTVTGSIIGVVDDDPSVRRVLDRMLRAYGFRVQAFASADEFLQRPANADRPACLIVDVHMEGKTGFDLVDVLRARGPDVPTIMMTGHREAWMMERAGKAAVAEFLDKPVDSDVLLEAIARALGP